MPGRSLLVQALWFFCGQPLCRSALIPSSGFRRWLLKSFGASIGKGAVLKPGVRVKYPWRLKVGDFSWLGEDCWIDNIADVWIGSNVCISQGAYLCTGNHDWSDPSFGLTAKPIIVEDGAWVGACAFIGPGVRMESHSVAAAASVITGALPAYSIWRGNPAVWIKRRVIADRNESPAAVPAGSTLRTRSEEGR